jgi:hypothetical protein
LTLIFRLTPAMLHNLVGFAFLKAFDFWHTCNAWKAFKEVSYSHCRYAKLHFHENSHFSGGIRYFEGDYQRRNAASSISFIVHKVWSFRE